MLKEKYHSGENIPENCIFIFQLDDCVRYHVWHQNPWRYKTFLTIFLTNGLKAHDPKLLKRNISYIYVKTYYYWL